MTTAMIAEQHVVEAAAEVKPAEAHALTVCKYGLLQPINWDQDCHEQLFLMNRLWNNLVELERKNRAEYRAIVGEDGEVAPLQEQLTKLRDRQTELRASRKLLRQKAQARVATGEIDKELRVIATEIQPLAALCKAARINARERVHAPLKDLQGAHYEAMKQARKASGLWWGNYNAVMGSYDVARSRAMKEGTELRFRRFTGGGRFTVQIIGGATPEEIFNDRKQVAIDLSPQPVPGRDGKSTPRLSMTLYTKDGVPRMLTWPLIYDYPLPECARIQQAVVTRRRVGTAWRYMVSFLCRIPPQPPVRSALNTVCGINLGFRQVPQGLRIATIFGLGAVEHAHLPTDWLRRMDEVETIRQRRDLALNQIHTTLRAIWPDRPPDIPALFAERLTNLIKAPKFAAASLAAIVTRWREAPYAQWWPQMLQFLNGWRHVDKLDFDREANLREHLIASRQQEYILLARQLASRFAVIRIGKMDLRKMAQVESREGVETELHQRARRNRQRAALYAFQCALQQQAPKFGAVVEYVEGAFTATCHICAGRCGVGLDMIHVCEHCSGVWDQDENAARNIFAGPRERSDAELPTEERSRD